MIKTVNLERFVIRSKAIWTGESCSGQPLLAGDIVISDGKVEAVSAYGTVNSDDCSVFDFGDQLVTPGYIDAHTHLIHYGSRENELAMRLSGKTYMEIHQADGGIFNTMRATREASKEQLMVKAQAVVQEMLQFGVTTLEAKSGYGLDFETEMKCLEVANEISKSGVVDLIHTFMGAHAVPPEWKNNRKGYLDWLSCEMLPQVAASGLAEFADIFCENGVFSPSETKQYLDAAQKAGFKLKVHADEIVHSDGAELAAQYGAVSAEHLMAVSDAGIAAMAQAGTVAVLLPGTTFFLQAPQYAPAKKLRQHGVRVALATDYNPGSSPLTNLQLAMRFGCFAMGLTPEEALAAVTTEAAQAISRSNIIGKIKTGYQADLLVHDVNNVASLIAMYGHNTVKFVYKNGKLVVTQ